MISLSFGRSFGVARLIAGAVFKTSAPYLLISRKKNLRALISKSVKVRVATLEATGLFLEVFCVKRLGLWT